MENPNQEEARRWVVEQTASLAPSAGWKPDTEGALARLHERLAANRERTGWRRWPVWVAAAALVVALILLSPGGRMVAQQFWQSLTVPRVAIIEVNPWPDGVPSPAVKAIGIPIPPIPARDAEDAGRRVHYEPRLPHAYVLSGSPRLSTTFSVAAGTVVKVADLDLALQKVGVTDQAVPPNWDGAQLRLQTSGLVIAEWPDIVLVQSLPLTLTVPQDFDFAAYSAVILRILGVGADEAQRLAQRAGTTAPWLAPFSQAAGIKQRGTIEEVALHSGPATLLTETGENGEATRVTAFWSVPDRVYLLSGKLSRELAISAADAVQ
jgi:hypothetical protein